MNDLTRVSIETVILLRQRLDEILDSEINRLVNGLYPNPDIEHEIMEVLDTSTYLELAAGFNEQR